MTMNGIRLHGRVVWHITTEEGQRDYYDHMNFWSGCVHNTNKRLNPTWDEANEYMTLRSEKPSMFRDLGTRKKYNKLQIYNNRYDWRPQKYKEGKSVGLMSPCGEPLLPPDFVDIFTQFDVFNDNQDFIPVFNGKAWALASLTNPTVLVTDFIYRKIIPERWEHRIYFVQDINSLKWGALSVNYHDDENVKINELMPPIADEIYEDELWTDCAPTLFFMTQLGDKIGILTYFGYSDMIYDTYECNSEKMTFGLIQKNQKKKKLVSYFNPFDTI